MNIFKKQWEWILHPQFADSDPVDWFAFLAIVLLMGLLWSKVPKSILE